MAGWQDSLLMRAGNGTGPIVPKTLHSRAFGNVQLLTTVLQPGLRAHPFRFLEMLWAQEIGWFLY